MTERELSMAQRNQRLGPDDLVLDFPMQVLIPFKRCTEKFSSETRKVSIPKLDDAGIEVKMSVTLHPDLYGVFPRVLFLWIADQITRRQYLPAAISREIPLIPFDLYIASLEVMNGVTAGARQDGLWEVFNGIMRLSQGFDGEGLHRKVSLGRNVGFVTKLRTTRKQISRTLNSWELSEQEAVEEDISPSDSVFKDLAILQVSEDFHSYAMALPNAPDMEVVRQIAHSPLALDIYADMLHRGISVEEWAGSDVGVENLWLDWPGKEAVRDADIQAALSLVKKAIPSR